jgi:uncharacterized membrane protein YczE
MSVLSNRRLVRRTVQLFVGLILYGVSMALMVESGLGLNPWDVLHQGLSRTLGLSIGTVVIIIGAVVLLLWIPLWQKPGFGTIANIFVIGFAIDAALYVLPTAGGLPLRIAFLAAGVLLNGLATGLYIGSRLGPGPRDGLMTGLQRRFPRMSLRVIRTGIELLVLGTGFLLGGTAGIGTVVYALAIGPLAQFFIPRCTVRPGTEEPVGARPQ